MNATIKAKDKMVTFSLAGGHHYTLTPAQARVMSELLQAAANRAEKQ